MFRLRDGRFCFELDAVNADIAAALYICPRLGLTWMDADSVRASRRRDISFPISPRFVLVLPLKVDLSSSLGIQVADFELRFGARWIVAPAGAGQCEGSQERYGQSA